MIDFTQTIAAIATPPGKGGVALIRISGKGAFEVADKCLKTRSGASFSAMSPRRAVRVDICMGDEVVDDGLATSFPAPASYTGEDTVEITCHGGVLVTRTVLEAVLAAGARMAEAGEFTRRAYLSGSLSLTEAEAIADLLEAQSRGQIRLASRESRGRLGDALDRLHGEVVLLLSSLFATIDYPEEDLAELGDAQLCQRLSAILTQMDRLLATYATGRTVTEGIATVICGRPNVGKSSLYNLLCCEDAAIVTDVAGTTRDVLEHTVALGDMKLRLWDTAGIRETADPVERLGVQRSRAMMEKAELVLAVFDSSAPLTEEDLTLIDTLRTLPSTVIAILNKSDLPTSDMQVVKDAFPHCLTLSAKEGDTTSLEAKISALFTDGELQIGIDPILSSVRQFTSLSEARSLVASTLSALEAGVCADVACSDLELALGALGRLDGREVSQEVVDGIFSHFCVGK